MNFDLAWHPRHKEVMVDFLNYLNRFTGQNDFSQTFTPLSNTWQAVRHTRMILFQPH